MSRQMLCFGESAGETPGSKEESRVRRSAQGQVVDADYKVDKICRTVGVFMRILALRQVVSP
jgi:hypothetical protein